MDVSVCIVNWNTREMLRRCLRSLRDHTRGLEFEVIVVDNASSDGSVAMMETEFPEVIVVASAANLGFAKGCNRAAAEARGSFVLYLNPDTELVSNAIHGMWRFLLAHSHVGAVGCKLLNSDGSIQLTCASSFPSTRNELTSLLFLDRLFPRSRLCSSRELNHWDHLDSQEVECLSGACMLMSRDLSRRLGGFDEQLFIYGEDLDLCCRISRQGLSLYYLATEAIYHHEGAASRKKGRSFAPLFQRAANYYFLRKHFGRAAAVGYRVAVTLGAGARVVLAGLLSPLWLLGHVSSRERFAAFLLKHVDVLLWSVGLRSVPSR
ncbi:glycosyltransferase family 2 protein [Azohydromonas australica]|uniref:glycosyltransferase family 2 protein n=1 Tax=Azohydromonas australica TaxID=364039 RepID=UPI000419F543|nr:glycosyltransferase family 2 protein [Azohydromonas australica]